MLHKMPWTLTANKDAVLEQDFGLKFHNPIISKPGFFLTNYKAGKQFQIFMNNV